MTSWNHQKQCGNQKTQACTRRITALTFWNQQTPNLDRQTPGGLPPSPPGTTRHPAGTRRPKHVPDKETNSGDPAAAKAAARAEVSVAPGTALAPDTHPPPGVGGLHRNLGEAPIKTPATRGGGGRLLTRWNGGEPSLRVDQMIGTSATTATAPVLFWVAFTRGARRGRGRLLLARTLYRGARTPATLNGTT